MKVEFKTSKGRFCFIKADENPKKTIKFLSTIKEKFDVVGLVIVLTEKQWAEVVESYWEDTSLVSYKNYLTNYRDNRQWTVKTATESGKSLMDSLNIEGNNWVLIKYL